MASLRIISKLGTGLMLLPRSVSGRARVSVGALCLPSPSWYLNSALSTPTMAEHLHSRERGRLYERRVQIMLLISFRVDLTLCSESNNLWASLVSLRSVSLPVTWLEHNLPPLVVKGNCCIKVVFHVTDREEEVFLLTKVEEDMAEHGVWGLSVLTFLLLEEIGGAIGSGKLCKALIQAFPETTSEINS